MGKRNGKSCTNCRHGETKEEMIENRSGGKKVHKYVRCTLFINRIRHPEKPCACWG